MEWFCENHSEAKESGAQAQAANLKCPGRHAGGAAAAGAAASGWVASPEEPLGREACSGAPNTTTPGSAPPIPSCDAVIAGVSGLPLQVQVAASAPLAEEASGSASYVPAAADATAAGLQGQDASGFSGNNACGLQASGLDPVAKHSCAEKAEVPVFRLSDVVTFTGGAAARRRELEAGDLPAQAELSTAEASIGASLRISLRLMGEAVRLIRTCDAWAEWSPAARVQRNRQAGQRKMGL